MPDKQLPSTVNFSTIDSLKENSPTTLCIWWQTLIKESQPISDAFFHFFKNFGWSRILGLAPSFWIWHYLPGVLSEFTGQAWQVTSHPKSTRTTGNKAVKLYFYMEIPHQQISRPDYECSVCVQSGQTLPLWWKCYDTGSTFVLASVGFRGLSFAVSVHKSNLHNKPW